MYGVDPKSIQSIEAVYILRRWLAKYVAEVQISIPIENQTRDAVFPIIKDAYVQSRTDLPTYLKPALLANVIKDAVGYRPIEQLLQDSWVTETMLYTFSGQASAKAFSLECSMIFMRGYILKISVPVRRYPLMR